MRLDVWLDVSCLFRTRSEAKRACEGGKIEVNRAAGTPHRDVRPGDEIVISRPHGRRQVVVVKGVAEKSLPKAEARGSMTIGRRRRHATKSKPAASNASSAR